MNELLILTMLSLPKVSRKTILKMNKRFDFRNSKIEDLEIILREANSLKIINSNFNSEDLKKAKGKAVQIIEESLKNNIGILTILDERFPNRLREIVDPPVILFYKGNLECLFNEKAVAIVGTRKPTSVGAETAQKLGAEFGKDGYVVVSGLAKGCDELGHKGCVDVNGKSIAILPRGLDKIYPASNKWLAESILENGGLILSEYPVGDGVFKNKFIERDRLQSALSQCVIVVETGVVGGTMHTVGFAQEQNKILVCYKHPNKYKNEKQTLGNQKLISLNKAFGFYTRNDILKIKNEISKKMNSNKNSYKQEVFIQERLI
ncbi:DNA-processing protein DprA [Clostridium perfringens]|uniref:DNA-processing protein DprA n=1 Tax=Clostridium perfringens TaxID=1502 RepID=UPI000F8D1FBA|nr:DNA-processing protein DprA [Clostridium perfringens]RUR40473.1 DNA-processing protein DprA [Clostridium perfringens]